MLNLIFGESQSMAGPAILTSGSDREVSELESESLARHISLIIPDYFRYNISDYGRIDPTLTLTRATIETRNHTQFQVTHKVILSACWKKKIRVSESLRLQCVLPPASRMMVVAGAAAAVGAGDERYEYSYSLEHFFHS